MSSKGLSVSRGPKHWEALQVVAFQAMMETMAETFPGAFAGYKLRVTESHQSTKADTSGTAKAVVASFEKLGAPISEVRRLLTEEVTS